MIDLAGLPVRELIVRLTEVEDTLRDTRTSASAAYGRSSPPSEDIVALWALEGDIIAELRRLPG